MNELRNKIAASLTVRQTEFLYNLYFTKYTLTKRLFRQPIITSETLFNICKEFDMRLSNCYNLIKDLVALKILIFHEKGDCNKKKYYVNKKALTMLLLKTKRFEQDYTIIFEQIDEYMGLPPWYYVKDLKKIQK